MEKQIQHDYSTEGSFINNEHICKILHPQIVGSYLALYLWKLVSSELFRSKILPEKRILQSFFQNQTIN